MQTTIIPFPGPRSELAKPRTVTIQVLHLDLAACELTERGYGARSGVYINGTGDEVAAISTDAPNAELLAAYFVAHAHLCAFLAEEAGLAGDELPELVEMQPTRPIQARSGYAGGRVLGYA